VAALLGDANLMRPFERRKLAGLLLLGGVWLLTTAADWPTYLHDEQRSGVSPDETTLAAANVDQLGRKWTYKTGGVVAASPTVVGGVVYVGSWDGYEYALDATTGALIWRTFLGTTTGGPGCQGPPGAGVSSAATVRDGVVYVGGGDSYWYALDAASGAVLWRVFTGDNSAAGGHYNWSSPLVYNGYAYIGVASLADCPLVQGQLLRVSLSTHQVTDVFKAVPDGQVGGGIWTSPSLDAATNTVFVTTGTWTESTRQPYAQAIVALDATSLSVKSSWQLPQLDAVNDADWGNTPLLFSDVNSKQRVAAINKNGTLYAFDRNNLAAGPVWKTVIAFGGQCPTCGDGSVSSGAFGAGRLYFGGGNTTIGGSGYLGAVRALDPSTGQVLWQHGSPAPVIPALGYANGVIVDGSGRYLEVLDAATGVRLYSAQQAASFYAAPSIANGMIYAATIDGVVMAFGLANRLTVPPDSGCPAGWTCQDIGTPLPSGSESAGAGAWSVIAGGAVTGGTSDQFRFVSQVATGDGQVSGAVTALQGGSTGGQAGVMIRQRADANAPYYAAFATAGGNLVVQERTDFGGSTRILKSQPLGPLPVYLEIQRSGDWFQAAQSSDGSTFTLIPGTTVKLIMPAVTINGVATSSGTSGTAMTASYTGVAVGPLGAPPGPAPSANPCPAGWRCQDVGNPALVGDQTLDAGSWTLTGAGDDIGGTNDQFHFVSQVLSGDASLSARVVSQSAVGTLAKAGLMIRQSVTDPASPYYAAYLTPGAGAIVEYRGLEGLKTVQAASLTGSPPEFLRVTRSGATFCAFTSADGATWTYVVASCVSISMSGGVTAGLAVTSRNVASSNTATFDNLGLSASAPPPPTTCPNGWSCADIGNPEQSGSQSVSGGTWSMVGTGEDIWGTWDQFHFVSQTMVADGTVTARVISVTNSNPWAKAGVMIRQSTDPAAAFYAAFLTAANGVVVQFRTGQGAEASMAANNPGTSPLFLRVSRSSVTFCAYTSNDGTSWTYVTGSCQVLQTSGSMLAGLAATSHNSTHYTVATFDAVVFSGTAPPSPTGCPDTWTCADIGSSAPAGGQSLSNGTWTIQGGGADINGTFDQFHYAWRSVTGDTSLGARLESQGTAGQTWKVVQSGTVTGDGITLLTSYAITLHGVAAGNRLIVALNQDDLDDSNTVSISDNAKNAYAQVQKVRNALAQTSPCGGNHNAYQFTAQVSAGGDLTVTATLSQASAWTAMSATEVSGLDTSAGLGSVDVTVAATSSDTATTHSSGTSAARTIAANEFAFATFADDGCWLAISAGTVGNPGMAAAKGASNDPQGGAQGLAAEYGSSGNAATTQSATFTNSDPGANTELFTVMLSVFKVAATPTDPWAKAGVMLRQSSDPGSPFYAAFATPGHGVVVEYRSSPGAIAAVAANIAGSPRVYLDVTRTGSMFCAYTSPDGVTWTYVTGSCTSITASPAMVAGLAVTSHNSAALSAVTINSVSNTVRPTSPCPPGWSCTDIGPATPAGNQGLSGGTWTVGGGGSDIFGSADQFHLVWQPLAADGTLSARLSSQTNTNPWAKAGLMLRQSLDPGSAFYAAYATPANGITVQARSSPGANVAVVTTNPGAPPVFLRVTRSNLTFCAYTSSDGATWAYVAGSCQVLQTSAGMLAGMAVTSHDGAALSTATFDAVVLGNTAPPTPTGCPAAWTCADIGSPSPAGGQSVSGGTWTIQGGGADISGAFDQFHLAWQSLAADGAVLARLSSQTNTNGWAKAGVMIRQSADPGSAFYAAFATPANGIAVQYRSSSGATAALAANIPGSPPVYLKVTRTGSSFCALTSLDGLTWTSVSGSCTTITASGPMLAGLAVTSHDGTVASTTTFDAVTVWNAGSPAWLRASVNVQHVNNAVGDSQKISIPTTVAGDGLVLTIGATGLAVLPQVLGITDNGATHATFARAVEDGYAPLISGGIWYAANVPAGITEVTINWNAGSVSNGSLSVWVGEYGGLATTGMLDKTAFHENEMVTSHWTGTTDATTAANELVVALYVDAGNDYTVGAPGSPWNLRLRADASGFDQQVTVDETGAALGPYSARFATPRAAYSVCLIATFKPQP
jgi:outer membrane protein assembly factor BamB